MKVLFGIVLLVIGVDVYAQNPEELFKKFKESQSERYINFTKKNDSLFAVFIAKSWQKFSLESGFTKTKQDRPDILPVFTEELNDTVLVDLPEDTSIIMRSFSPEPFESFSTYPEIETAILLRFSTIHSDLPFQWSITK